MTTPSETQKLAYRIFGPQDPVPAGDEPIFTIEPGHTFYLPPSLHESQQVINRVAHTVLKGLAPSPFVVSVRATGSLVYIRGVGDGVAPVQQTVLGVQYEHVVPNADLIGEPHSLYKTLENIIERNNP